MQKTQTFIAPSGYEYTLREQNGSDDEILSNEALKRGANFDEFVCSIVVKTNLTETGIITIGDMDKIPALDFGFIVMQSRRFSLGDRVIFHYEWDKGERYKYVEDLSEFVPDFSDVEALKELPPNANRMPAYPNGKNMVMELTLSSGKELRYHILTRAMEKALLDKTPEQRTANLKFRLRNLELRVSSGEFMRVASFKDFSPRDMVELRQHLRENDPDYYAISEVKHPKDNTKVNYMPILEVPDFFYPVEI